MIRKKRYIFSTIGLALLALIIWFFASIQKPPSLEVKFTREAISRAKKVNADIYAKADFQKAQELYNSGILNWKKENYKFIVKRDYSKLRKDIIQSKVYAEKAYSTAKAAKASVKDRVKIHTSNLREQIKLNQPMFSKLPIPAEIVSKNSHGQLMLLESENTYSRGKYQDSEAKLLIAEKSIKDSYRFANQMLVDYFESYPRWVKLADQTRKKSKQNNSYAIIVDKFSRECYVYYNGERKVTFDIELGKNWIGEKQYSGDKATPEGQYLVVSKKDGRKTKYYKALLLNYPNEEDKIRFKNGKENGTLQKSTRIGNLIEIHGDGGKGIDWTDGCIALENKDMDKLFKLIGDNTPVTIVGSLKPLNEILNEQKGE